MKFKKDFPLFQNNPWLIYLDNAASTQKPSYVIDGVSDFLARDYANIHRWLYAISERSEEFYLASKDIVATFLHCKATELFYTYNSTYGINIIAQSLINSWVLRTWDVVLVGIREHHSDIVPWQVLSQQFWFQLRFINITDEYDIDWEDFAQKYDDQVKVVAVSHVSNVTGKIYDVKKIKQSLRDDTFFLVDWSQSVPNFPVYVDDIWCDALVFTGHKIMAYTWIGVVYLKKDWVRTLTPFIVWWGTVQDVTQSWYTLVNTIEKFEAGTPNIIGAVSLLKAFEYIDALWWMETIWKHEQELTAYILDKFLSLGDKIVLIWPKVSSWRLAVFSFILPEQKNFRVIGEAFAKENICIRCWWHCAYPLHKQLNRFWTCRMSAYLYTTKEDIDRFFDVLTTLL